jgi:hypothetical protein
MWTKRNNWQFAENAADSQERGFMNFEVNGIPYFLTFDTSEAQWFLLTPSSTGIESVEIHNDGVLMAAPILISPSDDGSPCIN